MAHKCLPCQKISQNTYCADFYCHAILSTASYFKYDDRKTGALILHVSETDKLACEVLFFIPMPLLLPNLNPAL